jgi:hypothetical protein
MRATPRLTGSWWGSQQSLGRLSMQRFHRDERGHCERTELGNEPAQRHMGDAAPFGDMRQPRVRGDEEVGGLDGELPKTFLALREAGADVQTGRARMLCPPAKVEADTLELDS